MFSSRFMLCPTFKKKYFRGGSNLLSPAGAIGPGTGDIATPPVRLSVRPSVRLSVTFSFRTVTQKRIAVFSRNFPGTCTKSWGCAV